jgi:hypothetical protein
MFPAVLILLDLGAAVVYGLATGASVRTARIECESSIRGAPSLGWFHTAWYAPEAKRIVRLTSQYSGGPTQDWVAWSVQP